MGMCGMGVKKDVLCGEGLGVILKDVLRIVPCQTATEDFFRVLHLHEEPYQNILLRRIRREREGSSG